MTNRKKKDKIYKPKKTDMKAVPKKDKPSKALRNVFVFLQSLLGSFIVLCFFIYSTSSTVKIYNHGNVEENNISFYDLSNDYYKSDVFKNNFRNYVESMIRYVTISEQITRNGKYDPNIIIDVGEFAHRNSAGEYNGPEIKYKLGTLLEWGETINTDGGLNGLDYGSSICNYEFYTLEEYCKFFSIPIEAVAVPDDYDYNSVYDSFETLKDDMFRTVDGKRINEYAADSKEYSELVKNVQKAVDDLYFNYTEYKSNEFRFDENKTSFRYCVSKIENGNKKIYSNVSAFYKGIDEKFIDEAFIGYAEGMKTKFGTAYVDTSYEFYGDNADMNLYDIIRGAVQRDYAYAFSGNTNVWVGVDTRYDGDASEDVFSYNYENFTRSARMVPFVISLGAFSIICFIALFIIIIGIDRQRMSVQGVNYKLNSFEKMPIESMILAVLLIALFLYFSENWIIKQILYKVDEPVNSMYFMVPAVLMMLADLYLALSFVYSILRRVACRNVFEGSFLVMLAPKFNKQKNKLKGWFGLVSDSSAVAIRTWISFIMFLLFNCFWVCVMFFSSHRVLSMVVLLIFNICVGAGIFNRNYEKKIIVEGVKRINSGDYDYKIDVSKMHGDNKELAGEVNNIGLGLSKALEISTRDEKLKADLITNVSHDIKTPLTSIINYVDLLKRENIEDERVKKYIAVLDEKSQRLKQLTFDLLEASKVSSGNISIDLIKIDLVEFSKQAIGEFEDKFEERGLEIVANVPGEPLFAMVDPRHMWRVVENILNNVYKYAMSNTRVYFDLAKERDDKITLSLKNISNQQLNIPADELTERFIRGDVSRSTEGSGLGLSIAKNLTQAQGGEFDIYLDGDLFKVTITLDVAKEEKETEE